MKWDAVIRACREAVIAEPVLVGIYGEDVRMHGAGSHTVPLLEMMLVSDGISEQWAPCAIQFSQWTIELPDLLASERQLRRLFHAELPATFGGMSMWAQYVDGGDLSVPERDGYYGRAIRFQLTPLTELYEKNPYL